MEVEIMINNKTFFFRDLGTDVGDLEFSQTIIGTPARESVIVGSELGIFL